MLPSDQSKNLETKDKTFMPELVTEYMKLFHSSYFFFNHRGLTLHRIRGNAGPASQYSARSKEED